MFLDYRIQKTNPKPEKVALTFLKKNEAAQSRQEEEERLVFRDAVSIFECFY